MSLALLAALPLPGLGVSLLAPWALAGGATAAAGLVALHAITIGRPRPAWLPTARFAPDRAPRATRRLARPRDRALLAMRLLATALATVALARPVPTPAAGAVGRVVLVDRSLGAERGAVARAALGALRGGDVVVPFDAVAGAPLVLPPAADRAAIGRALDSLLAAGRTEGSEAVPTPSSDAASLSTALIAGRRAAALAAERADSVELVVVSPLTVGSVDAATMAVRAAAWPGRIRLLPAGRDGGTPPDAPRSTAARDSTASGAVARAPRPPLEVRGGPADDALAAALALAPRPPAGDTVRVVRAGATPADLAWARAAGHLLVDWPADDRGVTPPPNAGARPAADTAFGLVAGERAVVAPFVRRRTAPDAPAALAGRVVARWADGRPAAVERATGAGCVRRVAVAVPQIGDAALRPAFRAVLGALVGPCGRAGPNAAAPLAAADLARLAGRGPLLAAAPLRAGTGEKPDRLGAALFALAALALLLELPLRRRRRDAAPSDALDAGEGARSATVRAPSTREAA